MYPTGRTAFAVNSACHVHSRARRAKRHDGRATDGPWDRLLGELSALSNSSLDDAEILANAPRAVYTRGARQAVHSGKRVFTQLDASQDVTSDLNGAAGAHGRSGMVVSVPRIGWRSIRGSSTTRWLPREDTDSGKSA